MLSIEFQVFEIVQKDDCHSDLMIDKCPTVCIRGCIVTISFRYQMVDPWLLLEPF